MIISTSLGSLSAQTFIGDINPYPLPSSSKTVANDTVKILAVLVDFQKDKDAATFGNGKFGSIYSKDYGNSILDPLPHNQNYFSEHLEFVKNYFEKVSGGKLIVKYTVLPGIITVSHRMRYYSPPSNSNDFSSLTDFAKETWAKVDSAFPGFKFSNYNLFTIFHAGVGKDLSLPGSIGDQKNLPSIYLGLNAFQKVYGSNFKGFPISNNSFDIANTMIIPETESREMSTFGGTVLFQVTINGLLVASVASYLGLPDLFDTKTGNSAIGRFGLMDGQSIFAYSGIFPPEPSAWEKIRLGWAKPVVLSPGKYNLNVVTQIVASPTDTTIIKIPINSTEYYLVENRIRDAHKNGVTLTYVLGGKTLTKTFKKDTTGFYNYQVDSVQGVVTDVNEFDWALPGNGIVIWHIDNNIINSKIADNQINADINHRGVFVEEADGIWDIGHVFTTIFGDKVVGSGSQYDFWYKSNPSRFYHNKFSFNTRPNTKTDNGANSLITISNFSDIANRMSFNVLYGDSIVKPLFSKNIQLSKSFIKIASAGNNRNNELSILSDSTLNIYDNAGHLIHSIHDFSNFKIASINFNETTYIVGALTHQLNIFMSKGSSSYLSSINLGDSVRLNTAPVIFHQNTTPEILAGRGNGYINIYSLPSVLPNIEPKLIAIKSPPAAAHYEKILTDGSYFMYLANDLNYIPSAQNQSNYKYTFYDSEHNNFIHQGVFLDAALTHDEKGNKVAVILLKNNIFNIISNGKFVAEFNVNSTGSIKSFSLADLKQDGGNYIIFTNGNQVDAVNMQGAEANNFPFTDPENIGFTGTPLAADFSGSNGSEIIAATNDGRIFAIDGNTGKVVNGFPISTGAGLITIPVLFEDNSKISLATINSLSNFSAWVIGSTKGKMFWTEENGNNQNTAFVPAAANQNLVNEFFPKDRAYNYPNPVYGSETTIRYYVSEDSKIDIKIFDIAGDYVSELHDNAVGGMNNETIWNVSNIQSGIYLAHIQAQSVNGKTESNIIKIAIVK